MELHTMKSLQFSLLWLLFTASVVHSCPFQCDCGLNIGTPGYYTVDCSDRNLESIPSNIPVEVTELKLTENQISEIPQGVFSNFTKLRRLEFGSNDLTEIAKGEFALLKSLEFLDLSQSEISDIDAGAFEGLSNLLRLSLARNELEDVDSEIFSPLTSLQNLNLGNNMFSKLDKAMFANLPKLSKLSLQRNKLKAIKAGTFSSLTSLEFLYLENNKLAKIDLGEGFKSLPLKQLFLGKNQLTQFPANLPSTLTWLKLGQNKLKHVPWDGQLENLSQLDKLDLTKNKALLCCPQTAVAILKLRARRSVIVGGECDAGKTKLMEVTPAIVEDLQGCPKSTPPIVITTQPIVKTTQPIVKTTPAIQTTPTTGQAQASSIWMENYKCPMGFLKTEFSGKTGYSVEQAKAKCAKACDSQVKCKYADLYYGSSRQICYLKRASCGNWRASRPPNYHLYFKQAPPIIIVASKPPTKVKIAASPSTRKQAPRTSTKALSSAVPQPTIPAAVTVKVVTIPKTISPTKAPTKVSTKEDNNVDDDGSDDDDDDGDDKEVKGANNAALNNEQRKDTDSGSKKDIDWLLLIVAVVGSILFITVVTVVVYRRCTLYRRHRHQLVAQYN